MCSMDEDFIAEIFPSSSDAIYGYSLIIPTVKREKPIVADLGSFRVAVRAYSMCEWMGGSMHWKVF